MTLPSKYALLANEPGPLLLLEALKLYGVRETAGAGDNPVIVAWADEIATTVKSAYAGWAAKWYDDDSIPWCGLFVAVCAVRSALRAGGVRKSRLPPASYLSALDWLNFGERVDRAMLGDVLVFRRNGGGHVGIYVGEDDQAYHVLGGNQSDGVTITRIQRDRCAGIRRPAYNQLPTNVRVIRYGADGPVSINEA